jgi:hypothetical protein
VRERVDAGVLHSLERRSRPGLSTTPPVVGAPSGPATACPEEYT